jgi:ribonuclease HII
MKINQEISESPFQFDQALGVLVGGTDEVGRGALAGPLVSAAVLLDYSTLDVTLLEGIGDSKKITKEKREELYPLIQAHARAISIVEKSVARIDEINIHWADIEANHEALENIYVPDMICLADGFNLPDVNQNSVMKVIKGDAKSAAIGAASIVAKVYRDRLMVDLGEGFPEYGFKTNVGYGTHAHWRALMKFGLTPHHRRSFPIIKQIDPEVSRLF